MREYVGGYYLLATTPWWQTALFLLVFTIGILYPGRWMFEGRAYNVAFSSNYGDIALTIIVVIGVVILQQGVSLPSFVRTPNFHVAVGAIAFMIGCALVAKKVIYEEGQIMDIYHDIVIVPLFLYLLGILAPVIYFGGTAAEKTFALVLLALWATLVIVDIQTERMDQRRWLEAQGVEFPEK